MILFDPSPCLQQCLECVLRDCRAYLSPRCDRDSRKQPGGHGRTLGGPPLLRAARGSGIIESGDRPEKGEESPFSGLSLFHGSTSQLLHMGPKPHETNSSCPEEESVVNYIHTITNFPTQGTYLTISKRGTRLFHQNFFLTIRAGDVKKERLWGKSRRVSVYDSLRDCTKVRQ